MEADGNTIPMPLVILCSLGCSLMLAGCFDPRAKEGLACSGTGGCPAGQTCSFGTCYEPGNAPEVDAAPDANPISCATETLASGQSNASDLDVSDESFVYWTANLGTLVLRSPKLLGPSEVFHDSGLDKHPFGLALDATHVYWSEADADGRIMRKAKSAASTDPAEELATAQGEPVHIALDATHVYWSNLGAGTVNRLPKAGGAIEVIAIAQAGPSSVKVDETHVFWLNTTGAQVMRSTKTGPPLQQLAGSQDRVEELALGEAEVVWTDSGEGVVRSVSKEGGAVQTLASGQATPASLALSASDVYWCNEGRGEVVRTGLGGGPVLQVADGQSGPGAIALDGEDVYWLNVLDVEDRVVRGLCE